MSKQLRTAMRIDQKISEFVDGHLAEQVIAEVRPYLGASMTWFRFGLFRRSDGEVVRGMEVSTAISGLLVRLVPLSDAQIDDGIKILSRIHERRQPGVWKFRDGFYRYRMSFRKFAGSAESSREEVKAHLVMWTWLSAGVAPMSMYRHQIKGLVEALEKLRELPQIRTLDV